MHGVLQDRFNKSNCLLVSLSFIYQRIWLDFKSFQGWNQISITLCQTKYCLSILSLLVVILLVKFTEFAVISIIFCGLLIVASSFAVDCLVHITSIKQDIENGWTKPKWRIFESKGFVIFDFFELLKNQNYFLSNQFLSTLLLILVLSIFM